MSSVVAVIDEVTKKETKTGKMMYTVEADGKKFTFFDEALATAAKELKGQKATIFFVEKTNGEFLNRNITSIDPVEKPKATTADIPLTGEYQKMKHPTEQLAICRAVALNAAVAFQGGKGSVLDVKLAADEFFVWLSGDTGHNNAVVTPVDDGDGIPF